MATVRPLPTLRVTSPFGTRDNPLTPELDGGTHLGVDYAADVGDLLHAVGDGVVTKVNRTESGGLQLFLRLDDGQQWSFSHLLDTNASTGDRVAAGEVVALTGDTGRVTGPHVHVQAIVGGALVDPDPILRRLPSPIDGSVAGATKSSRGGLLVVGAALAIVGAVVLRRRAR